MPGFKVVPTIARLSGEFIALCLNRKWFISHLLPVANQYIRVLQPTVASRNREAIGAVIQRRRRSQTAPTCTYCIIADHTCLYCETVCSIHAAQHHNSLSQNTIRPKAYLGDGIVPNGHKIWILRSNVM